MFGCLSGLLRSAPERRCVRLTFRLPVGGQPVDGLLVGAHGLHRPRGDLGERVLWREGDDLINGERFFAMEQLCYSDAATVSINKRALAVFDYLKHVHPDDSDEIVAASMGYTPAAIQRIQDAELAQDDGYDDEEPDEDDTPEEEDGETEEKTAIPFDFA